MITIWTNGCFDILHPGHIELFKVAKSLGDRLIVGVDTDLKVKADKGANRPINNLEYRKAMLCLLYTSPSPRDATLSRMPSSA